MRDVVPSIASWVIIPAMLRRASGLLLVALACAGCLAALEATGRGAAEWPAYGNDPGGTRYSPLREIDRTNVAGLRVAWTARTGDTGGARPYAHVAFEATPLMLDGTLYLST